MGSFDRQDWVNWIEASKEISVSNRFEAGPRCAKNQILNRSISWFEVIKWLEIHSGYLLKNHFDSLQPQSRFKIFRPLAYKFLNRFRLLSLTWLMVLELLARVKTRQPKPFPVEPAVAKSDRYWSDLWRIQLMGSDRIEFNLSDCFHWEKPRRN